MDHIAEWKRITASKDKQNELDRKQKKEKKRRRLVKIKAFLVKSGAENINTNGYVWDFDYKGMSGHFCDQTNRIVGAIHRPFISEDDKACYLDMEKRMRHNESGYFTTEYCYNHFCINGRFQYSLCEVFRLIKNVIMVRKGESANV